jgi:hypothetical protein
MIYKNSKYNLDALRKGSSISTLRVLLETWQPNLPIDLKQLERIGLYHDLQDSNIDEV